MNDVYEKHVFVCVFGKTCPKKGPTDEMFAMMKSEIKEKGLADKIRINKAGCLNWCDSGPAMVCYPEGKWYTDLTPEDIPRIMKEDILPKKT